jgi:hypothetical protein
MYHAYDLHGRCRLKRARGMEGLKPVGGVVEGV